MLRRFAPLAICAAVGVLVGCSPSEPGAERTGETEAPIINGSVDSSSADDAIVAVLSQQTECTGTVIAQNGTTGYVLTAAHCCDPTYAPAFISVGSNYAQPQAGSGNVTAYQKHPSYTIGGDAAQPFDFCVVTFTVGNGKVFPVISAMTSATDNVTTGTQVTAVGYGQTVAGPEGSDQNSLRKQIGPIHVLDFYQYQVTYNEQQGGTCFGDSGGPDLATGADGQRHVFGVHSFVSGYCNDISGSGIVSDPNVYDNFIAPIIGQPVVQDCSTCTGAAESGTCHPNYAQCLTTSDCASLLMCANACGDATCVAGCAAAHPGGIADYNSLVGCVCGAATCSSSCSSECSYLTAPPSSGTMSGTGSLGVGPGGGSTSGGDGGGSLKDESSGDNGGCSASGAADSTTGALPVGLALALIGLGRRRRRS